MKIFNITLVYILTSIITVIETANELRVCNDIIGPIFDLSISGGVCFSEKKMSFQSCLDLLKESNECSALSYKLSNCVLFNRKAVDFLLVHRPANAIVYFRLTSELDNCTDGIIKSKSPILDFRRCVKSDELLSSKENKLVKNFFKLPNLAIVLSFTYNWADNHQAGIEAVVSNLKCYCSIHNYSLILNTLPQMSNGKFFTQRHEYIVKKYLPYYQHIMHIDADSLILNLSKSLDPFLNSKQDVQLHLHENGEVSASTYLIRNSHYTRCFMKLWSSWSPPHIFSDSKRIHELTYETLNYDNGDLVSALLYLINTTHARQCIRYTIPPNHSTSHYLDVIVRCFRHYAPNLYQLLQKVAPGIRIYLPREGYWRTHGRRDRFQGDPRHWWNELYGSCFSSSDIIGHGWKAMGRKFWSSLQVPAHLCTYNSIIHSKFAANPNCRWLSPQEELDIARKFCTWRSPICQNTSLTMENTIGLIGGKDNLCLTHGSGCYDAVQRIRQRRRRIERGYDVSFDRRKVTKREMLKFRTTNRYEFKKEEDGVGEWNVGKRGESDEEIMFNISSELWIRQQICATCPI